MSSENIFHFLCFQRRQLRAVLWLWPWTLSVSSAHPGLDFTGHYTTLACLHKYTHKYWCCAALQGRGREPAEACSLQAGSGLDSVTRRCRLTLVHCHTQQRAETETHHTRSQSFITSGSASFGVFKYSHIYIYICLFTLKISISPLIDFLLLSYFSAFHLTSFVDTDLTWLVSFSALRRFISPNTS